MTTLFKKNIFGVFFTLLSLSCLSLFTTSLSASCRITDTPDEEFLSLGYSYKSVGMLFRSYNNDNLSPEANPSKASAVLIDTSNFAPSLNGTVAVTAAHAVAKKGNEEQKVYFGSRRSERISCSVIVHPDYYQATSSNDIALLLLNSKPEFSTPAQIAWDVTKTDLLDKPLTTSGYGLVTRLMSPLTFIDTKKRASKSCVFDLENKGLYSKEIVSVVNRTSWRRDRQVREVLIDQASLLHCSPFHNYQEGKDMSLFGLSTTGDSGGGTFLDDGRLVGITSTGSFTGGKFFDVDKQLCLTEHFTQLYPEATRYIKEKAGIEYRSIKDLTIPLQERYPNSPNKMYNTKIFMPYYKDWVIESLLNYSAE